MKLAVVATTKNPCLLFNKIMSKPFIITGEASETESEDESVSSIHVSITCHVIKLRKFVLQKGAIEIVVGYDQVHSGGCNNGRGLRV